jgi:transcriptional regulator with XRE-family HTH domain
MTQAFRLQQQWTLGDAASRLLISKQMLSMYENSRKLPSIKRAHDIALIFGMDINKTVEVLINELLARDNLAIRVTVV